MIRALNFKPLRKRTLRGYTDLELPSGLILRGCSWHENENGDQWVGLPTRAYTGADGSTKYAPVVEFAESAREARKKFQEQALAAIRAVAASDEEATP
jgi:hypothetical protein